MGIGRDKYQAQRSRGARGCDEFDDWRCHAVADEHEWLVDSVDDGGQVAGEEVEVDRPTRLGAVAEASLIKLDGLEPRR